MARVSDSDLVFVEPEERLVVLARTLDAKSEAAEETLEQTASEWKYLGATSLGRSLFRHHSIFRDQSDALVWSHQEFIYFRDVVPIDAINQLVTSPQPPDLQLLRAELLVTTPRSFVFPREWKGSSHRRDRKTSIEYVDVDPPHLREYREIMRRFNGPAASRLVAMGKLGTFRTMETAAVLFQSPALAARWNQIHLSEVDAENFQGFGQEFYAALRDMPSGEGFEGVFAGLDQIRTIPRWTLNDPVVEEDAGVGQWRMARTES